MPAPCWQHGDCSARNEPPLMSIDRRALLAGIGSAALLPTALRAAPGTIALDEARLIQGGWARGRVAPGASVSLDANAVAVGADGRFFIAFDRDSPAVVTLSATGQRNPLPLAIAPRHWQIEQIDAPFHPPALPDAEFLALRKTELARINAARRHDSGASGWRQRFTWPALGRISGHFGSQRVYRGTPGTYHSGTDIAGAAGSPITAPADGVVNLAAVQAFTLEGHLLMLDHGAGLNSAFLHCSELLVREGEAVRQGQTIARIGMTGRATGPHLHWSLRWKEARLDPELFAST